MHGIQALHAYNTGTRLHGMEFSTTIMLKFKTNKLQLLATVLATGNIKMKCVQTHLVAKLKRVCIHHAQVMVGTVERSKHDFY